MSVRVRKSSPMGNHGEMRWAKIGSVVSAVSWRLRRMLPGRRPPIDVRTVRIVTIVPSYLPSVRAGSEVSMHDLLRRLTARGMTCSVLTTDAEWTGDIDGVSVRPFARRIRSVKGAGFVFTQLAAQPIAMRLAARFDSRLIVLQHMGKMGKLVAWARPDIVVYNTDWLRESHRGRANTAMLHPTIDVAEFVGCADHSGADTRQRPSCRTSRRHRPCLRADSSSPDALTIRNLRACRTRGSRPRNSHHRSPLARASRSTRRSRNVGRPTRHRRLDRGDHGSGSQGDLPLARHDIVPLGVRWLGRLDIVSLVEVGLRQNIVPVSAVRGRR